jgi:hypothetical protein
MLHRGIANRVAAAAGLLLCALWIPGRCQTDNPQNGLTPTQKNRLAIYETSLAGGDPAAADDFLKDKLLIAGLAEIDPQKEAALKARAEALKDLKELLAMPWDTAKMNSLNQALTIRIDLGTPLSGAGVGPEPEKLLFWLAKYQPQYPADKTRVLKQAIRQWEVIFGTMTDTTNLWWGQAKRARGVNATKAEWRTWTLRERNTVMARIIAGNPMFIDYSDTALTAMKKSISLEDVMNKAVDSGALSQEQLLRLSGRDLADQLYLLGSFFDGSNVAVNPGLKAAINAARDSMPKEVLPAQQRALLGTMLNTAVSKELAGTQAGAKALAFYAKDSELKIAVQPCDGSYSRYDAASGTIILDSETIQQYMRIKGYTADSLMKNKEQLRETAVYVSPLVVYEAVHEMRAAWAYKRDVYNPRVQEGEIEAMSLEGLYTSEKIKNDPAFRKIFNDLRAFSDYAAKRVEIAAEFRASGSKKFATTVRQRYFSGLPSLDAAAAQILGSVTAELDHRAAMTPAARIAFDSSAASLGEALEMTPEELSGSAGEICTPALEKLRKDLADLATYKDSYKASDSETRAALNNIKTGSTAKKGAPPIL